MATAVLHTRRLRIRAAELDARRFASLQAQARGFVRSRTAVRTSAVAIVAVACIATVFAAIGAPLWIGVLAGIGVCVPLVKAAFTTTPKVVIEHRAHAA
jgi:hypothetical protein